MREQSRRFSWCSRQHELDQTSIVSFDNPNRTTEDQCRSWQSSSPTYKMKLRQNDILRGFEIIRGKSCLRQGQWFSEFSAKSWVNTGLEELHIGTHRYSGMKREKKSFPISSWQWRSSTMTHNFGRRVPSAWRESSGGERHSEIDAVNRRFCLIYVIVVVKSYTGSHHRLLCAALPLEQRRESCKIEKRSLKPRMN